MKNEQQRWDIIDAALSVGATLNQIKLALEQKGIEITTRTIQQNIQDKYETSFSEYREYRMGGVKMKLIQTAIQQAMKGNSTMLIFCLKNLCGWADKFEQDIKSEGINVIVKSNAGN